MSGSPKFIDLKLLAGIGAVSGTSGTLSQIALPLLVSSLIIGLSLSEQNAGLIVSLELITAALVSFCIAPKVHDWPRRLLAVTGALIAITGHALSALATDLQLVIALRVLAGIGAGVMLATGNASVASSNNPDRMYSLVILITGAAHLVVLTSMPVFIAKWSHSGAFAYQAMFILLMLPLMFFLPKRGKIPEHLATETGEDRFPLLKAIAVILMVGLFFTRETALYGFSQEIGMRTGLSFQEVGNVLGAAGLLALVGAAVAAVLGTRFGRLIPVLIGLLANTIMPFMISQTDSSAVFTFCQIAYHMALFFTVPYLFGMIAELDPKGRLLAVGGGALTMGGSIGPAVAGVLITWGGYRALGAFILISMTLVTIIAVLINAHIKNNRSVEQGSGVVNLGHH